VKTTSVQKQNSPDYWSGLASDCATSYQTIGIGGSGFNGFVGGCCTGGGGIWLGSGLDGSIGGLGGARGEGVSRLSRFSKESNARMTDSSMELRWTLWGFLNSGLVLTPIEFLSTEKSDESQFSWEIFKKLGGARFSCEL
jgi:hypothetical protein